MTTVEESAGKQDYLITWDTSITLLLYMAWPCVYHSNHHFLKALDSPNRELGNTSRILIDFWLLIPSTSKSCWTRISPSHSSVNFKSGLQAPSATWGEKQHTSFPLRFCPCSMWVTGLCYKLEKVIMLLLCVWYGNEHISQWIHGKKSFIPLSRQN